MAETGLGGNKLAFLRRVTLCGIRLRGMSYQRSLAMANLRILGSYKTLS